MYEEFPGERYAVYEGEFGLDEPKREKRYRWIEKRLEMCIRDRVSSLILKEKAVMAEMDDEDDDNGDFDVTFKLSLIHI